MVTMVLGHEGGCFAQRCRDEHERDLHADAY
jgi:hypothetical protein